MPSVDLVEVVAGRLAERVPSRTIYSHSVPALPDSTYIVVRASVGETGSLNLSDRVDTRSSTVYVTSVSRRTDASEAGREAAWGSQQACDALMDWRAPVGQASWRTAHVSSASVRRDDSLPDAVLYAVDQYVITYQP